MPHICQPSRACSCYLLALEPDENCPIHGAGEWPPRCGRCGRFLVWPSYSDLDVLIIGDGDALENSLDMPPRIGESDTTHDNMHNDNTTPRNTL